MAQRYQFPSDIATILLAAGSSICIQVVSERLNLTLEEFLERSPCDHRTLLLSIYIPCWISSSVPSSVGTKDSVRTKAGTSLLFETYRAAPRPLGNTVAYLNSAFLAQVSSDKMSGNIILDNLCLAFGAYGTQHAVRARKVENLLMGKPIAASILLEACQILKETIVPKEGTTHASYRSSLAVAFLFSFLYPVANGLGSPAKVVQLNGGRIADSAGNPIGDLKTHANILLEGKKMHLKPGNIRSSSRQSELITTVYLLDKKVPMQRVKDDDICVVDKSASESMGKLQIAVSKLDIAQFFWQ